MHSQIKSTVITRVASDVRSGQGGGGGDEDEDGDVGEDEDGDSHSGSPSASHSPSHSYSHSPCCSNSKLELAAVNCSVVVVVGVVAMVVATAIPAVAMVVAASVAVAGFISAVVVGFLSSGPGVCSAAAETDHDSRCSAATRTGLMVAGVVAWCRVIQLGGHGGRGVFQRRRWQDGGYPRPCRSCWWCFFPPLVLPVSSTAGNLATGTDVSASCSLALLVTLVPANTNVGSGCNLASLVSAVLTMVHGTKNGG